MDNEYYGATQDAERCINALLALPGSGVEQDWEIEFADPARIDSMLDVLENTTLDTEMRSALWLLIAASFDLAFGNGRLSKAQVERAKCLISQDHEILSRMRFYWLILGRSDHPEDMRVLLSA